MPLQILAEVTSSIPTSHPSSDIIQNVLTIHCKTPPNDSVENFHFGIWRKTPWHGDRGHISKFIYDWYNQWHKFITKDSITLDIGCHNGDSSIPMLLGGAGRVLSFDPSKVIDVCRFTRENNPQWKDRWEIYPYAISEKTGDLDFLYGDESMVNGGPKCVETSSGNAQYSLPGINFEEFFRKQEPDFDYFMRNISFIKIDCEGYDMNIMRSMSSLLQKYHPVLYVEWFLPANPNESRQLFELIYSLGYKTWIPAHMVEFVPTEIQHNEPYYRCHDILCLPIGKTPLAYRYI